MKNSYQQQEILTNVVNNNFFQVTVPHKYFVTNFFGELLLSETLASYVFCMYRVTIND
jgi:hypothetical protein